MLDKTILDQWKACHNKAEQLVGLGIGSEQISLTVGVARSLFDKNYMGLRLEMTGDIATLKDDAQGFIKAGAPSFLGLFGRDSLIVAWQLMDYDPTIARNTLVALEKMQGRKKNPDTGEEPGKILHELYPENVLKGWWKKYKSEYDWLTPGVPNYMSVDSTLLYLIVAAEYVKRTGDYAFYEAYYQSFLDAMQWATKYGMKGGKYVSYGPGSKTPDWGLQNQSWKDSKSYSIRPPVSMVEVQGYLYAAITGMAELDRNRNPPVVRELRKSFNRDFWSVTGRYYAMALNGDGEQVREVASNPGHLLFTGILTQRRARAVVKKLFSDELWTPYGIRTHSTESDLFDPCGYHMGSVWPFDNWIIAQGLKKMGFKQEYDLVKKALYRAYSELGYIPEYYGVTLKNQLLRLPACFPQAWSSGALLNFAMEDGL